MSDLDEEFLIIVQQSLYFTKYHNNTGNIHLKYIKHFLLTLSVASSGVVYSNNDKSQ